MTSTDAGSAVDVATRSLAPVSLSRVMRTCDLQDRVDQKYFVPAAIFADWVAALGEEIAALEIAGRRRFRYESTYFDDPGLVTFRDHRQGRRRRYKVRTRTYLDSGECCLEVKLAGNRNRTVKERAPHLAACRNTLSDCGERWVRGVLDRHALRAPGRLEPTLTTSYLRTTLLLERHAVRVTCDTDLECRDRAVRTGDPRTHVIVEVKSLGARNPATAALLALGLRPVRMSKYCVGIALVRPGVRANPWHAVLRRYFGWSSQVRAVSCTRSRSVRSR